jgi:cellulose synthase/poly-beta-1,6-N-acetylglucosamine synthase-like glycosyltransferase
MIFWCCAGLLLHSYLLYPLFLWIFARGKTLPNDVYENAEQFPAVSVLLSAHNEAQVIGQKLRSTLETSFPLSKLEFLIGSDASSDQTDAIIQRVAASNANVKLIRFENRCGKIAVMNQLAERASGEILMLTDANVFFTRDTISELVKHFKRSDLAVVAGNIQPPSQSSNGIAEQESAYQLFENHIKYREGVLWGATMGAFGGCYAVRKEYFTPTPSRFIVDDFYITLAALQKGGKAIMEPAALCHEEVSELLSEEFRRKSRIGAGNFQIMGRFVNLLSPAYGGIAFAFLSHKVLRWLGPFFIIGAYLSNFAIAQQHPFYIVCLWIQTILFLICFLDVVLGKLNVQWPGVRYISHFYLMNLALLNGFFKFITGIEHNVWQPTQRKQSQG